MKLDVRRAGVLLPVFSLAGSEATDTGTLADAHDFIDVLANSGASIWQILPLGPTHADGSPYLSLSAHAGNTRLLAPGTVARYETAAAADLTSAAFADFDDRHGHWLHDYVLYRALRREHQDKPWFEWPRLLRDREIASLAAARVELAPDIRRETWLQFEFYRQWHAVRAHATERGIHLFGDMPLYVAHDSADVWQHRSLFQLDDEGQARVVAGVPPDYFSATGQRWGNPIYDWSRHVDDDFTWWRRRMRTQATLYDVVRIDHFRGLEAYWEVPGDAPTAETGEWRQAPGHALLHALKTDLPELTLVAEDLGTITPAVDELRRAFDLPGIRVLHFGFDGMHDNPHAPENIGEHVVLYTGTHDNDTSVGWYESLPDWQRDRVHGYLVHSAHPFPISLCELALASPANTVIIPLQDLLGYGADARVNVPGTDSGNWCWQLPPDWDAAEAAARLKALVVATGRVA